MENFDKNIDQLFSNESKKAEESATFPSFDKVWEKIENRLDESENKKNKTAIPIWLPYSIVASLVFAIGIIYFYNNTHTKSNNVNFTSNESPKVINNQKFNNHLDSSKITRLNQSIKQNIQKSSWKENSKNNNLAEVKLSIPQILTTNSEKDEKESLGLISKNDVTVDTSNHDDNTKILAYPSPSPIITENKASEPESIIETNKYKSLEMARIALNTQKKSEQLSALAEQSGFVDNTNVEDSNDFKISQKNDSEPLYIVDGYVADTKFMKSYNKKKITSLNIVEGNNAKKLYGNLAKKGVIVITTKGLNPQEMDYLKKNSKNYNFSETTN